MASCLLSEENILTLTFPLGLHEMFWTLPDDTLHSASHSYTNSVTLVKFKGHSSITRLKLENCLSLTSSHQVEFNHFMIVTYSCGHERNAFSKLLCIQEKYCICSTRKPWFWHFLRCCLHIKTVYLRITTRVSSLYQVWYTWLFSRSEDIVWN